MSELATESEETERRIYHAQLITCLAVVPTFMGLASLFTGASMGNRELRALLLAHLLAVIAALAFGMLFVLAWWLMGRRQRAGVLLALALFGWMLVSDLTRFQQSYLGIAFAVVGLVVAARAWPAMQRPVRLEGR
jgi:uncharacterized membrane protein (GlpM family)